MMQNEATPGYKVNILAADEQEKEHDADINGLVERVEQMLIAVTPIHSEEMLTISIVPAHSRALGDKWYTPNHVSIGPHHWRSSQLRCEVEKTSYLDLLLKSFLGGKSRREKLECLFAKVMQLQKDHRVLECYGTLHLKEMLGKEELMYMLLLDGCYLVSQFGRGRTPGEDPNWEVLVLDTWYLLENQMPFLVVEEIDKLMTGCTDGEVLDEFILFATQLLRAKGYISERTAEPTKKGAGPWEEGVCKMSQHSRCRCDPGCQKLVRSIFMARPVEQKAAKELEHQQPRPHHLLHLLHTLLTQQKADGPSELDQQQPRSTIASVGCCWRRASEYVCHGNVQFVGRPLDGKEARSVLDVRIEGRKVLVPRLHIEGTTWMFLLNLLALEKQHGSQLGTHVTAYCMFLSQVACTAEDVKLLQSRGVITTSLGAPEKVAANIRELCNGVNFDVDDPEQNYLYPIFRELEELYQRRWHNFLSWCRLNYWSIRMTAVLIGVIAGAILLAAGVISAVYAVLMYEQEARGHH